MKTGISIFVFAMTMVILVLTASSQNKNTQDRPGPLNDVRIPTIITLSDGKTILKDELFRLLDDHEKWCKTNGKEGYRLDFSGGNFQKLDLHEFELSHANLSRSRIYDANLSGAELYQADLSGSWMWNGNLSQAKLQNANLRQADLVVANLKQAFLAYADLSGARLMGADLRRANLKGTILTGVDFFGADLKSAVFEPKEGSLPDTSKIALAKNIELLTFEDSPSALIELRGAFKKSGFREQERKITYAILHAERIRSKDQGLFAKIEAGFRFIMFEATCDYGMSPGRPLEILLSLILLFAIFYAFFLGKCGTDGIWQVWLSDRVRTDLGGKRAVRLKRHGFSLIGFAFYFSLLSAFNIGWRELNVGNWISRMQPKEYTLRASGTARLLSGLQSVISVYLLALSVLTYFGRPFE